MQMMHIFITIIGILPPPMEIFKVFDPHLGMTLGILRLIDSMSHVLIRGRALRSSRIEGLFMALTASRQSTASLSRCCAAA
jgi:hypothetical protein